MFVAAVAFTSLLHLAPASRHPVVPSTPNPACFEGRWSQRKVGESLVVCLPVKRSVRDSGRKSNLLMPRFAERVFERQCNYLATFSSSSPTSAFFLLNMEDDLNFEGALLDRDVEFDRVSCRFSLLRNILFCVGLQWTDGWHHRIMQLRTWRTVRREGQIMHDTLLCPLEMHSCLYSV